MTKIFIGYLVSVVIAFIIIILEVKREYKKANEKDRKKLSSDIGSYFCMAIVWPLTLVFAIGFFTKDFIIKIIKYGADNPETKKK